MNLIGKIFTLLIFLMSIVFLVVAVMVGASDREWKETAAEMSSKARQATESLQNVQSSTQRMDGSSGDVNHVAGLGVKCVQRLLCLAGGNGFPQTRAIHTALQPRINETVRLSGHDVPRLCFP